MRFLVIGLGSMGKRRIRNLRSLGENDIIGFDIQMKRRKECEKTYNIKTYVSILDAMNEKPDVLIISTSPDHHLEYEQLAIKNNKHFFCEASVLTGGIQKLIKESEKRGVIAAPSATFRFDESIKNIKKMVNENKIGKICAFTYHMGQYLPDWHPSENIKDYYVSKKEVSATREMVPFELEWLTWIFGDIKTIFCLKGKCSSLPINIDDVYQLIFTFESGVIGHLLVEVISRKPIRSLNIIGDKGTLEWDWYKNNSEEREKMYVSEMKNFINAVNGKEKYKYSLREDLKILRLLESAEKCSSEANI